MAHQSIRATAHIGPFPELYRVRWNPAIGRVTIAQRDGSVSLHLHPDAALALAAELVDAADTATGQQRRYDVARLVIDNTLVVDAAADDQLADAAPATWPTTGPERDHE